MDFAVRRLPGKRHKSSTGAIQRSSNDSRVRIRTLDVGDRVLVRNVLLRGKNKLADKWEHDPYIVREIPNNEVPVYRVRKESGKGSVRTLHRNLLLPFMSIPCSDIDPPAGRARSGNHRRDADQGNENHHVGSTSEAETGSSDDSESLTGNKYVIPARRNRYTRSKASAVPSVNVAGRASSSRSGESQRDVDRNGSWRTGEPIYVPSESRNSISTLSIPNSEPLRSSDRLSLNTGAVPKQG